MPLPEPIRSFFYAYESLAQHVRRTEWGLVVADARFPDIYDANKAMILEAAPDLHLDEIISGLSPVIDSAGIGFEHVEFMDMSDDVPAMAEAEAVFGPPSPDVVMDAGRPLRVADPPSSAVVREVTDPDEAFWRAWIDARPEFGVEMPVGVLDQLLARDRSVYRPAGMRLFGGYLDGELAGFASLLSLEGAGYIDSVVTAERFRRQGVAGAVVRAIVDASLAAGDGTTFLLTDEDGGARSLYERLGFRAVARASGSTRVRPRPSDDYL